jgi:hypothetical protein
LVGFFRAPARAPSFYSRSERERKEKQRKVAEKRSKTGRMRKGKVGEGRGGGKCLRPRKGKEECTLAYMRRGETGEGEE